MNELLIRQLAIDYCCTEEDVKSKDNIFTVYQPKEERRIFEEEECFLKVVSINGKILATGRSDIIVWVKERYENGSGAWFMEADNLIELDQKLREFGCKIGQAHPFYLATEKSEVDTGDFTIVKYIGDEIEQFRDDDRFDEAFIFQEMPKDELGVAAVKDGKILGMAGATSDSDRMWQIGINVMPEAEGLGIGSMLVALIKNDILDLGKLPFYGTGMSHIASQRVAIRAGFFPAWAELVCEKR